MRLTITTIEFPARTVAFIGDSITLFWPLAGYLANTLNKGSGGQDSHAMNARFSADIIANNPWAVHILAGTNDVEFYANPVIDSVTAMALAAKSAGIRVILATIPPVPTSANRANTTTAKVKAWNAAIVAMARENRFQYVDYHTAMTNDDGLQNFPLFKDEGGNFAHPTNFGYDRMFETLIPALSVIL